jgi:7-carboxy-7-deazaguanine synthase
VSKALRITEIFYSLQGESSLTGLPTVFIRLTGCPLRCKYCDTVYAFSGGMLYQLEDVLREVSSYQSKYVTVTGGEPLAQQACRQLLSMLCDAGFVVSLETSGAMDISGLDERVIIVMDLKTPGSGEQDKNMLENLPKLARKDQLKFVICNREDYLWSKQQLELFDLNNKVSDVLFSPSKDELSAKDLAEWVLEDRIEVRFQLQLHKLLWEDQPGH